MENSFYSEEEIKKINFKKIGNNVLISRKCSIYSSSTISIGNNSRIDDFSILSGNIEVGDNVHIAAGCYLFTGDYKIELQSYSCISSQTTIYALTDDYLGDYLTNATIPTKYRNVMGGNVILEKHVVVGTGCTILPNVILKEGCSVGAKSLINKTLDSWSVYKGIPATFYKERKKGLIVHQINYEKELEGENRI